MSDLDTSNTLKHIIGTLLRNEKSSISVLTDGALSSLCSLAGKNDITAMVSEGLIRNGTFSEDDGRYSVLHNQIATAVFRYERMKYVLDSISMVLDREKIEYIPLKGAILRDLYPDPWMRTSSDIDILLHNEDIDKAIECLQRDLNYSLSDRWTHEISLYSDNGVHIELHYDLIEEDRMPKASAVLERVWSYTSRPDPARSRLVLTNEMFYYYHIAHMAKHFKGGGCGVRALIDLWLLCHKLDFDEKIKSELLAEGGLDKFNDEMVTLSECFFSDKESDGFTEELEKFVFDAGMYGDPVKRAAVKRKDEGKAKYILKRLYLPYETLKLIYPKLEGHKWLTPFYNAKRFFVHLKKGRLKYSSKELKAVMSTSDDQISDLSRLMNKLGINDLYS